MTKSLRTPVRGYTHFVEVLFDERT